MALESYSKLPSFKKEGCWDSEMNTYIMEIIDLGNQEVIVQIIKIYSISEETFINIDIVEFYQPFIFLWINWCRQPPGPTICVTDVLAKVVGTLKKDGSMQTAVIAFKSCQRAIYHSSNIYLPFGIFMYSISRTLYGNHWKNIYDLQFHLLNTITFF